MKQERITKFIKPEDANQKWYIIDAKDRTLGRMAAKVARVIRGKEKPVFTPNMDAGDFVIVINAEADENQENKYNSCYSISVHYLRCEFLVIIFCYE